MNRLTKEQAIAVVGADVIKALECESVDYTGRLTDGSSNVGYTEFATSVDAKDTEGEPVTVTMHVFIDSDNLVDCDDLSNLDWDSAIADAEFTIQ